MADPVGDAFALPLMWTELAVASWFTVCHRTALIATGACTTAEYERMVTEKVSAMHLSSLALLSGQQAEDVLRPFHKRAMANARRLET